MARNFSRVRPKSNRIEINYRDQEGIRHFFSVKKKPTQTNLAWAERHIEDLIAGFEKGQGISSNTFASYAQDYLNSANLALSTRNSYRDSLNIYWIPTLEQKNIINITYRQLRQLDESIEWTSPKTRKNAISALKGVFALAYKDSDIAPKSSPAHSLDIRKHQKPTPDPFTIDERTTILSWFDSPDNKIAPSTRLYFRTAFGTGMRSGELIALDWDDFDGACFNVVRSRVRSELKSTKTDEPRQVMLPGWLRQELSNAPGRFQGGAIFRNQYGRHYTRPNKLNDVFRKCLRETGIKPKAGPYPWRHTYASIGLSEGVEPAFLAKQLGHKLATFYRNYAIWIDGENNDKQMAIIDSTF